MARGTLFGEGVADDVAAHLQGAESGGGAVAVHFGIFPAVAEVTFPGEEADEATFPDEAVALWGEVVVLVDFGQAIGELVVLMIDGVGEWELYKVEFGEDSFHLWDDELAEAVVIVDVEEAATDEVAAEVLHFAVGEEDVAVACEVEEGVVEEVGAAELYGGVLWVEAHVECLVAESDEVGQRGGVGVPIAASTIFDHCQLGLSRGGEGCEEEGAE